MADIIFKAPNGEIIVALNEIQADAFRIAGLEEVKATKKTKTAEQAE